MNGLSLIRIGNGNSWLSPDDPHGEGFTMTHRPASCIEQWRAVLMPKQPLEKYARVVIEGLLLGKFVRTSSVCAYDTEKMAFVVTENSIYHLGTRAAVEAGS